MGMSCRFSAVTGVGTERFSSKYYPLKKLQKLHYANCTTSFNKCVVSNEFFNIKINSLKTTRQITNIGI